MERLIFDLRTILARARPWCLRAASVLRIVALAVSARALLKFDLIGIAIALWLCISAGGLWWRRVWAWRLALLGDVVIVVGGAVMLVESGDLQLFGAIAAVAAADTVLQGLGQAALAVPPPPQ